MSQTGFKVPGAGTQSGGSNWTNPGNILSDNGVHATATMSPGALSNSLVAGTFDFSEIHNDSVIDGIEVRWQLATDVPAVGTNIARVRVVKPISQISTPAPDVVITTSMADYTVGGPAELWGLTWTAADIKNSGFQTRLTVRADALLDTDVVFSVDVAWINVYYTPPGGGTAFIRAIPYLVMGA